MKYKDKIISLLNMYISENDSAKRELESRKTNNDLYKTLKEYFVGTLSEIKANSFSICLLISTIYSDGKYDDIVFKTLYNLEIDDASKNKFIELKNIFESDCQKNENEITSLENKLHNNMFRIKDAKSAIKAFNLNIPIDNNKVFVSIKSIIIYYETAGILSPKETLLLLNDIDYYNRLLTTEKGSNSKEKENTFSLYNSVPNILTAGFIIPEKVEISNNRKDFLEETMKSFMQSADKLNKDDFEDFILSYQQTGLSDNEYNYFLTRLLDYYSGELIDYYNMLFDDSSQRTKSERDIIVIEYYKQLEKYLSVYKCYEDVNDFEVEDILEVPGNSEPEKELIFVHAESNYDKSKIFSDIKDVPHEYYDRIEKLLRDFKQNQLGTSEFKYLSSKKGKTGYYELRDDQIRIVLKHISENIYCVMGLFAKKDNNDRETYRKMINRLTPDITTDAKRNIESEFAKMTFNELEMLIQENSRKGNR